MQIAAGQKVNVGDTLALTATATDVNGATVALSQSSLLFSATPSLVSQDNIATLTPDGSITGKGVGGFILQVSVDGVTSDSQTVNVQVANLKVAVPEQQSVKVGETKAIALTTTDNNNNVVPVSAGAISYTIVSGGDNLTIAKGQMTGVKTGFAVINSTVGGITSANQTVFIGDIQTTSTGLKYFDGAMGTGDVISKSGDTLSVNYTGTLLNGSQFDSSRTPGRTPFEFPLGAGQVIKGWDEGFQGIKPGTRRYLIIPANLAYGEQARTGIPANSTLLFDTELLTIKPQ